MEHRLRGGRSERMVDTWGNRDDKRGEMWEKRVASWVEKRGER